jgi:DNA invertase Pin-like site-specific DNA recombinase
MTYDWRPGDYLIAVGRISDSEQKTIPEQYEFCNEGAARVGLSIPQDGYYKDIQSRSDDISTRSDLAGAFKRLEDPNCRGLVVWTDSRLLGDARQALDIMEALTDNGCRLFTRIAEIDVATVEGQLIGMIKGHLNRVEVERLRERVKDTHMSKARKGRLISRPPFAIQVVPLVDAPCGGQCKGDHVACNTAQPNHDFWHGELSDKNTVWIWNQDSLAILRYMFEVLASGKSFYDLQNGLKAQGVRVPERVIRRSKENVGKLAGGGDYSIKQLGDIVKNEFYRGTFRWNMSNAVRKKVDGKKKKVFTATAPDQWVISAHTLGAAVNPQVWDDAQANIAHRKNRRDESQRKYPPLLWDGLLECGRCGWSMTARQNAYVRKDGVPTYVFDCGGYANIYGACTKSHQIAENTLDFYVLGLPVTGQGRRPPAMTTTFSQSSAGTEAREAVARIEVLLTDLNKQDEAAERIYIRKSKSDQWLDGETARIDADRRAALAEKIRLETIPDDATQTSTVPEMIQKMGVILRNDSIPMMERQTSLCRLIDRIVIDRPGIRVVTRKETA